MSDWQPSAFELRWATIYLRRPEIPIAWMENCARASRREAASRLWEAEQLERRIRERLEEQKDDLPHAD